MRYGASLNSPYYKGSKKKVTPLAKPLAKVVLPNALKEKPAAVAPTVKVEEKK